MMNDKEIAMSSVPQWEQEQLAQYMKAKLKAIETGKFSLVEEDLKKAAHMPGF